MCFWKSLKSRWVFSLKKGTNPSHPTPRCFSCSYLLVPFPPSEILEHWGSAHWQVSCKSECMTFNCRFSNWNIILWIFYWQEANNVGFEIPALGVERGSSEETLQLHRSRNENFDFPYCLWLLSDNGNGDKIFLWVSWTGNLCLHVGYISCLLRYHVSTFCRCCGQDQALVLVIPSSKVAGI